MIFTEHVPIKVGVTNIHLYWLVIICIVVDEQKQL